jgi:hypothetical protein
MAGLGLKSWVASFPSLPLIYSLVVLLYFVSLCVSPSLSLRITQAHLHRPLQPLFCFEFQSACFVGRKKSLGYIMAEKFMTGALYEACYVV